MPILSHTTRLKLALDHDSEIVLPLPMIVLALLPVSIACDAILSLLSTCPIPMITLVYTLVAYSHFRFNYFFDFFLGMNLVLHCALIAFIFVHLMFLLIFLGTLVTLACYLVRKHLMHLFF